MGRARKCFTDGCTNDSFYVESGLCQACYAAMYYWRDKTPTQIIKRQNKLSIFQARMEMMAPANVKHIKRKVRKTG